MCAYQSDMHVPMLPDEFYFVRYSLLRMDNGVMTYLLCVNATAVVVGWCLVTCRVLQLGWQQLQQVVQEAAAAYGCGVRTTRGS